MVPSRLGPFDVDGILGEGGSALVYSAREGEREVALKVLHADLCLDERQVLRFLEEAERMRRVDHRALVPVLGAGRLPGGRPYIVMPRLRGRTVAERIHEAPVPLARALPLFEDVAFAVAALHAAGLVHRDIKPENVFWIEPDDRLVLLDLGIARDSAASPSTTTKAGFMRGTPAYMAPERLFGQPATVLSDIYELALLLYLMLTARLPWEEGDAVGRVQPILREEDRGLIPPPLAGAILEAMSFDVTKRPPSVAALLGRVRRAASGGSAETPAASWPKHDGPALAHTPRVVVTPPSASSPGRAPSEYDPTVMQSLARVSSSQGFAPGSVPPPGSGPPHAMPESGAPMTGVAPATLASAVHAAPPPARWKSFAMFGLGGLVTAGLTIGFIVVRDSRAERSGAGGTSTAPASEATSTSERADPSASVDAPLIVPVTASASAEAPTLVASASATESAGPVASASISAARVNAPVKEGFLPKGVIESRVRARMGQMNSCVSGEASKPGFQQARVTLNFWIGTSGNVTSASGNSADLPPAVVSCVVAQVRSISFPQPEGGPVNVIFPIRFKR